MEEIPSHRQMCLLISSHVSAQVGHHQVILDEYTNSRGMPINYNGSIKFFVSKILVPIRFNAVCVFLNNHLMMACLGRNMLWIDQ
jgi:hypothetical protein